MRAIRIAEQGCKNEIWRYGIEAGNNSGRVFGKADGRVKRLHGWGNKAQREESIEEQNQL